MNNTKLRQWKKAGAVVLSVALAAIFIYFNPSGTELVFIIAIAIFFISNWILQKLIG